MKVALHSELAVDSIEDYREDHERIPEELRAVFDVAGIAEWTIWRSGNRLFHLIECDDFDEAMRVVNAAPANARWQRHIGRFVTGFLDADGRDGLAPLEEIWDLQHQRNEERSR
ncbi:L-rhamnose mutarotase [Pseudactinotalea sp. Z1748]|uniref:L-rhamnose mutarotase n=1 Tax=Pseudactinotalea sp. Z1748 TaxID=3413027 RepID=UPI003C7A87A6